MRWSLMTMHVESCGGAEGRKRFTEDLTSEPPRKTGRILTGGKGEG